MMRLFGKTYILFRTGALTRGFEGIPKPQPQVLKYHHSATGISQNTIKAKSPRPAILAVPSHSFFNRAQMANQLLPLRVYWFYRASSSKI